jgi:hypothetical protein
MDWLRFALLGEKTMRIRKEVIEEARQKAVEGGDAPMQTDKRP